MFSPPTVDREGARSPSLRGPDAHHARPATTRRSREPATVPSRSTRRTRPAGVCRPEKWIAGSSRSTPDPVVQPASYRPL